MKLSDIPKEFTTYKMPWYDRIFTLKYDGYNIKVSALFGSAPCKSIVRTYWNGEVEIFKITPKFKLEDEKFYANLVRIDRHFTRDGFTSTWDILERRVLIEKTGFYL